MVEEESFQLLSSMSPNVKNCQRHFRKGTTVLALRRSLHKSSLYDKSIHTQDNDKIFVTEVSSTSTTESRNKKLTKKALNITPISIHDSESENELKFIPSKTNQRKLPKFEKQSSPCIKKKSSLSKEKFESIKHWIDNVNIHVDEIKSDSTLSAYSELSTIYGEENGGNFITERTGKAVSSTGIGNKLFHEIFKLETNALLSPKKSFSDDIEPLAINELDIKQETGNQKIAVTVNILNTGRNKIGCSVSTIDETEFISNSEKSAVFSSIFTNDFSKNKNCKGDMKLKKKLNNGFKKNSDGYQIQAEVAEDVNDSNHSSSLNDNNKNISPVRTQTPSDFNRDKSLHELNINDEGGNEEEVASMLDDLYGTKWREKEEHVLFKTPKTEPRKQVHRINDLYNSEQKHSVLYKNPYLDTERVKSNNLLRSLQKSRLKMNEESPALKRLINLCDSDADSNSVVCVNPRAKLNFDDSDGDYEVTSKYFRDTAKSNKKNVPEAEFKRKNESDKENFDDLSFFEQSLEERVRRKLISINEKSEDKRREKNLNDKKLLTKKLNTDSNKIDKNNRNLKTAIETSDKKKMSNASNSSDDIWEEEISKIVRESKIIKGKYSFLASLSANVPIFQCDMSARIYRNNFKSYKEQLLTKLFEMFNEKVFENAIPQDTALEWNDRMRGTAGFCYCKKITRRTGTVERTVKIVLSTKVIDAAYRLRDTLIHEMCHAATWIVNCVSDGHGPYWKAWACKAMQTFPELPPIKRCHDYVINTKYTYKCTGCGYSIGRHSKSLDIERKRCGYCLGKFEILLNKVSKKGETKSVPATPKKKATGFALFVKENYSVYKQGNLKHGEVMKLLGQKFQEMKLKA